MWTSRFWRARFYTARFWEEAAPAAPTFNPVWVTDTDQVIEPTLPIRGHL